MDIEVTKVNAFVADGRGGNLAGVMLDAGALSTEQMQFIATEVGASETAFVGPTEEATNHLRFFTPTVEVPLCGHATIATWWLLNSLGLQKPGEHTQMTAEGILNISLDEAGRVFMEQPPQELKGFVNPNIVVDALGISLDVLSKDLPPQIMQRQLMIGLTSEAALHELRPNLEKVSKVSEEYDFFGFHVYVLPENEQYLASVRNFCPRVGIDEDAATGTGNGSFLEYLRSYNKLPEQDVYQIEQGIAMGQHSRLFGMFRNGRVWIGGTALPEGQLTIDI
ncbi:MAG: PhzF family phenazine biosynthesis protein [Patescibacteria group bacterium]|nr:PhzF family phenazine biosynthesis protein [Patescibacteria group bacterium]